MQTSVVRTYIPAVLIVLLAGEVIFLLLQNRELKERLNQMTRPAQETLKKGDRVLPTTLTMLDGSKMEIEYVDPSERYLFFVFSTTCPYCEKNLVNWNEVAGTNVPAGTYVLGVSTHELEQTKEYVA
jgi:thioredoxin-related protein